MLTRLVIRDYLLVHRLELEFGRGLSVITGETGAGKSMIAGALDVLLGERFPKDAVPEGAERAVIEGYFALDDPRKIYEIVGDEETDQPAEILVRREISRQGRTRSMLNDRPIAQEILLRMRDLLADFHGQREHQSLFAPATQLEYLDIFAESGPMAADVRSLHEIRTSQRRELERLTKTLNEYRKDRALLVYQLEEIERLGLKPGEEEAIESRLTKLESAEKIAGDAARLDDLLSESESSMTALAGRARITAAAILKLDKEFATLATEFGDLESRVKELASQIREYQESLQFDPAELENLRERRGIIWKLKRKHGVSVEDILRRAADLKTLMDRGEELEAEAESLQHRLEETDEQLISAAETLSKQRRDAAPRFAQAIIAAMKPLGFAAPRFEVQLQTLPAPFDVTALTADGADRVQFLFSANPGTRLAPLSAVASGGESSRVTLAIKSVLASKISYPLMVYDEIDLGISGKVADQVGNALLTLARRHQVLTVTHLPQIASRADHHLLVTKQTHGSVTRTTAKFLSPAERIEAVAALIAGVNVTEKALASANELLRQSGKITNPT